MTEEYTSEENKELVETIKGPRFYRIMLWGYGGEAEYMKLTKEQFDFWHFYNEEYGDSDGVNYCTSAEDGDFDFENIEELPEEMQFLKDPEEDYSSSWYEAPTSFAHQYGIDYNNARLTIEEVDGEDYGASVVKEIVDGEDLPEYISKLEEDNNYELELTQMDVDSADEPDYVAQMYSAEKGTFFEGVIETVGAFDPKKLKIHTTEYLNGDDTVESIEYNGVDVDNGGGDTNGKGYSFHAWKNEQAK